jgi:hypothetical protein
MLVFIKKTGFIIIIFVGLTTLISLASLWSLRQSSFYKPSFLVNTIQEKEFDYIIVGSSTGLTTLNTKVIDSTLQTNGLNLSMDDTALSSQYLMLQHFLAQGKTTAFCILAPSTKDYEVENNELSGNDYRFLPYITNTYVSSYFRQYSSQPARLLRASKWLPILGVSYYNTEIFYPSLLTLIQPTKRNRFDDRGNYTYPKNKEIDTPINEFKVLPIAFKNPYLEKMKALCARHNIKLICYFPPIKGAKVVVNETGFTLINHSAILKNETYFYDTFHVNYIGRQVSSAHFSNSFKTLLK